MTLEDYVALLTVILSFGAVLVAVSSRISRAEAQLNHLDILFETKMSYIQEELSSLSSVHQVVCDIRAQNKILLDLKERDDNYKK